MEDMEKTKEIKLNPQQDHPRENEPKPEEAINQEDNAIPSPEQNDAVADSEAREEENGKETTEEEKVLEAGTVKDEEEEKDLVKKPNGISKQNHKSKFTVPQPFSLATDKRMSRERRASIDMTSPAEKKMPRERRRSMDLDAAPPKLAKSVSFNKVQTSSTTKPIAKPKHTVSHNAITKVSQNCVKYQSKIQMTKEAESQQVAVKKQQGKGSETSKLAKSSTFKALPLPSFYRKNAPPAKPSIKKVPVTQPKSPLLGVRNKATSPTSQKTGSTPRTITNSTKDKITKLLNGARKALNSSKETVKAVAATA